MARQYLVLWRRTSTGLPAAHQHLCTAHCHWDLEQLELFDRKCPRWQPLIRAWVTGHMHQEESSQLNWPAPRLAQMTVLVHVDGTYIGQVIIFSILFKLEAQLNICCTYTCMIKKSLKEHTGFTEIPGRLAKAFLGGKWRSFSELWWCCPSWMSPWMLATPSLVSFT